MKKNISCVIMPKSVNSVFILNRKKKRKIEDCVLTVSPRQSSLFFVIAFVAFAEVEEDEHVYHHPHQRSGQHHLTVRKLPHLHT